MYLKISRVLHAGYIFETQNSQIIFDPIFENPFSTNCYAYPSIEFDIDKIKKLKFDAIFISHYHDDHCSLESLHLLDKNIPIYLYCELELLFIIIKDLGFKNVFQLKIDIGIKINDFIVTPRLAIDPEVDCVFEIQMGSYYVLNVVDSWIDIETTDFLSRLHKWDLILWPFQTMREIEVLSPRRVSPNSNCSLPNEWLEQLLLLNPRMIVPSSCQFIHEEWSWYNNYFFPISYSEFCSKVNQKIKHVELIKLNPGETILLTDNLIKKDQPLDWVLPRGPQDVDYNLVQGLQIPSTKEISVKFSELSLENTSQVYDFCTKQLVKNYNSLSSIQDSVFNDNKSWKLSVYDHLGDKKDFLFKFENLKMILCENDLHHIIWTTEISVYKLYCAIYNGEALSSLYLRINDQSFSKEIEDLIQDTHLGEDPLIRVLYEQKQLSYQLAQLHRLNKI